MFMLDRRSAAVLKRHSIGCQSASTLSVQRL